MKKLREAKSHKKIDVPLRHDAYQRRRKKI
jgi:hypothetical protein